MVDATAAVAAAAERVKDRSSVQFAHYNDDDAILAKTTIDLAHKLGLKVVEGVENTACLALREKCDCDTIQGHLISTPVTLDNVMATSTDGYRYAAAALADKRSEPGVHL